MSRYRTGLLRDLWLCVCMGDKANGSAVSVVTVIEPSSVFRGCVLYCTCIPVFTLLNEMARRKLFSPRTKSQIKRQTGEKCAERGKSTKASPTQHNTATGETVCVQVRDTFCMGVSAKLRTELWQSILKRPGIHNEARNDYDFYLQKAEIDQTIDPYPPIHHPSALLRRRFRLLS